MKKLTSLFLVVMILLCSVSVFANAEETTDYDAKVSAGINTVWAYNSDYSSWYALRINVYKADEFEYIEFDIRYNTDVIRYQTIEHTAEAGVLHNVESSDIGCIYKIEWLFGSTVRRGSMRFDILSAGDINFDVTATGYYPDGTRKQLNIDLEKPYDKVVDISEVEFLDKEKYEYIYQHALIDLGTTAGELVSASGAKTAAVINADGEILDADKPVSTGAFLATMYEGFVVDSIEFVVKYDVNGDGIVTAADARLALRISSRLEVSIWDAYKKAADVNNFGGVTAADARLILRKAAKLDVSDIP